MYTELHDRTLWFDGDSVYPASSVFDHILTKSIRFVDVITHDIAEFNRLYPTKIEIKHSCSIPLDISWNIPHEYAIMDVDDYVINRHNPTTDILPRTDRLMHELSVFKQLNMYDILRTLIYIVNTMMEQSVVWGVGRGSSVASYVLYVIGTHDVDSFKYELDFNEFIQENTECQI
jgi:hypothetical protein